MSQKSLLETEIDKIKNYELQKKIIKLIQVNEKLHNTIFKLKNDLRLLSNVPVKEDKLLKIEAELISSKEKNINRIDQIYTWIKNAKSYTLENSQVQNAIKSSVAQLQNALMRVSAIGNKEYKELIKIKALSEEKFNYLNSEINTLIVNLKQALQSAATSQENYYKFPSKAEKQMEIIAEKLENLEQKILIQKILIPVSHSATKNQV
ncbi:49_t:CDS:2 [Gigaspora rosea]|nr:49_t:CDS:2 [Gigaspora rosea]